MDAGVEEFVNIMADKFLLMVLVTQYGKTFQCIKIIEGELKKDKEQINKNIHIVFTMNTIGNNAQFTTRVEQLCNSNVGVSKQDICVVSSQDCSSEYRHFKKIDDLWMTMSTFDVRKQYIPKVIVMCSNYVRWNDSYRIAEDLNIKVHQDKLNISGVSLYYDEIDMYMDKKDKFRNRIEDMCKLDIVKNVYGLTATPKGVWSPSDYWKHVQIAFIDHVNPHEYIGVKDMKFETNELDEYNRDSKLLDKVKYVLEKNPHILEDGTRVFIPASNKTVTHDAIMELVFRKNPYAVVIRINGLRKSLTYKTNPENLDSEILEEHLDISTNQELSELMFKKIKALNLETRPVVITGYNCVSAGQTLLNPEWGSFTSAIFAQDELTDMRDAYQLFGRITGRMKSKIWKQHGNYCQTTVYCSTSFMNKCIHTEECTRSLSQEKLGDCATEHDYDNPPNQTLNEEQVKHINKTSKKKLNNEKSNEEKLAEINKTYGLTELYDNPERAKKDFIDKMMKDSTYRVSTYRLTNNTTIQIRGETTPIKTYESESQFKLSDTCHSLSKLDISPEKDKTVCRIMPVKDTSGNLKWIGIYLKKAIKKSL